jgi:predicted XRE-type DNA-binding protein
MANTITRKSVLTKAMEIELFSKEEKDVIKKMIDSLDHKSSKPTKAQTENLAIKVQIAEILTQPMTAREIADALGISTNKVASLLRQMDVEKIKGEKSKDAPKYALLASTDVEADEE